MAQIVLFVALIIAGFVFREMGKSRKTPWAGRLTWPSWVLGVVVIASISFVTIDQDSIGHLERLYLGKNMKPGQIIAFEGEKGSQARILGPGFHFIPLVRAQIAVQVAELEKEQPRLKGEGEKLRLIEIAKGQRQQTNVLGENRVYQLAVLDKVLQAAVTNPNIVKIPNVPVQGESGGFEGPAAILGASNLMQSIGEGKKAAPAGQ